jgi:hypothetical protein
MGGVQPLRPSALFVAEAALGGLETVLIAHGTLADQRGVFKRLSL